MPLTYRIDPGRRLVEILHHGRLGDPGEWLHLFETILSDPVYEPGFNFLEDLSDVDDTPTTDAVRTDVRRLIASPHKIGGGRFAVVIPRSKTAFWGLARMAELTFDQSPISMRVFTSADEALAWVS